MFKRWMALSALIVAADYATKWMALHFLTLFERVPIFSHFNLTLVYNKGAAFSFLGDQSGWQRWFLSAVALVISVVIIAWLKKNKDMPNVHKLGLTLILGGALGNLIDRVRFGYVVDFLDFYWGIHHFPAFNIADSAITCGAILLLLTFSSANSKNH
ncbi:MAG: signal peptidase II [Legionellales bacterium]|jgi:signal peptidase II